MRQLLIYPDTSVFGGCFDDEFAKESRELLDQLRTGRFQFALSAITARELIPAPAEVRDLVRSIPRDLIVTIEPSAEIDGLRDAYVDAGVVGHNSRSDAEHIASATVGRADLIVSWNFKHIVNFQRIRGYHSVNIRHGYHPIPIHSPPEVIVR